MTGIIIQTKSRWMSEKEYKATLAKVDQRLFFKTEKKIDAPQGGDNKHGPQKTHRPALDNNQDYATPYILQLEQHPENLGEIKTLQQLLVVLGAWANDLLQRKRNNLLQFLAVIEHHYADFILQQKQREKSHTIYVLDHVFLLSCNATHKKIILQNDETFPEKNTKVSEAISVLAKLFSNHAVVNLFLAKCPKAAEKLEFTTLQQLAKKHIPQKIKVAKSAPLIKRYAPAAHIILTQPNLVKRVGSKFVERLYAENPHALAEFLNTIDNPAEFLTTHRDWLTGNHLLEVIPVLLKKHSPYTLKNYLFGKEDANGHKPIQKLKTTIVHIIENDKTPQQNQKVATVLKNNHIRGWLNLTNTTWLQWAQNSNYNPQICQLIGQGRELYSKTRAPTKALEQVNYVNLAAEYLTKNQQG